MNYTIQDVKRLREQTGAGVLDSRNALAKARTWEEAVQMLVATQRTSAEKVQKNEHQTREGSIFSYIHHNQRAGVLLELNCSTDFVARSESFRQLARELAMHITAKEPSYIYTEQVPLKVKKAWIRSGLQERAMIRVRGKKREDAIKAILDQDFARHVLVMQPWIRDSSITVGDLVGKVIAETREKIVVRRFARFVLGEE